MSDAPDPTAAEQLDQIEAFIRRFVSYPNDHARVAHVLWIAHTHTMTAWESTPRLAFLSPEPGSGKSRGLEITELLVPRPVHAMNTTPAYLFRKVADPDGAPTILYDEIDTVFGPRAKDNEDTRGMLNAGHRRGAKAGRCVVRGNVVVTEELEAYCAVALAGLGDLPDTILSRSIVIKMRRRAPGEHVEPFRHRMHAPAGHDLRDRIAAWAAAVEDKLADAWPEMPEGIEDRNADVWEPLLAVADVADDPSRVADKNWPQRARDAAVALVADLQDSTPSLGLRLLSDIRDVFDSTKERCATTDELLTKLKEVEEAPWLSLRAVGLDARGLAKILKKYEIKPKVLRVGKQTPRGYDREDFVDPWSRYLPPPRDKSATGATSETGGQPGPPCTACKFPLDPALAAAGDTTHPTCGTEGAA